MSFSCSVKKLAPEMVVPAGPTPGGHLPLSFMDRTAVVRILVDLVLVFNQGLAPATAIKAALSRALVAYYPVAGRIVEPRPGKTEVACTGDGVWFVEASVECGLKDANNLEHPLLLPKEELIPFAPSDVNEQDLIFMMQVTNFTCGGFAVGIRFSHTVFDGLGAAQFIKAVAELARGHVRPGVDPVWCRDAIPTPTMVPRGHPPTFAALHYETAVFDVSADRINLVKNLFSTETDQKCSTFDVVTAIVWQCRTRAIGLPPAADVHLGFPANTRHLLPQLLPQEGFYGNCVYPIGIKASRERIGGASLVKVIEMIRDAKERMSGAFLSWVMGDSGEGPYLVPLDYGTMIVSDWSRVGFEEVNYGWGEPMHVAPLNDESNLVPSCIYLQPSKPKLGIRLMTRCVEKQHLPAFTAEMSRFLLHI